MLPVSTSYQCNMYTFCITFLVFTGAREVSIFFSLFFALFVNSTECKDERHNQGETISFKMTRKVQSDLSQKDSTNHLTLPSGRVTEWSDMLGVVYLGVILLTIIQVFIVLVWCQYDVVFSPAFLLFLHQGLRWK